jgi:hypothetical protein
MKNKKSIALITAIISISFSCKNYLNIDPPKDRATSAEIFSNDASATSSVTGIYSRMASTGGFSGNQNSISTLCGLTSDELKSHSSAMDVFFKNEIPSSNSAINLYLWTEPYAYIYTSNAILEGLKSAPGVSINTNNQLQGEAKFIRAFCYFYLVNLFGQVPLNLNSDYRENENSVKASPEKIYEQIVADLLEAESLLSSGYISTERIRPNKATAKALLSRVYLYNEKWDLAAQKATEVIDQKTLYTLSDLDQVFLKNSTETIWQLMPNAGNNTQEGALNILTATPTFVSLVPNFLTLFESGDNRKTRWVGQFTNVTGTYYFPYKYKIKTTTNAVVNEYSMVLRLAELHLIRAECRAKLNLPQLALEDINLIRKRAGLIIPLSGLNSGQCLLEIEKQRQLEFFAEWGHRWFDLKRTLRASTVLSQIKGNTWTDTDVLFPIPDVELTRNPSLGY